MRISLIKSSFYNELATKKKLADFILKANMLSMNEQCYMYEQSFSRKQKRKFSTFVNSGSTANLLLIQALLNLKMLKPGDLVGFSALTWATNVMPLIQLGLVPVPIDCDPATLNISPSTLAPHLNNLKGLFLTNVLGFCDNIQEIQKLCDAHHILLFEDNCESLGSEAYGKLLGNFGIASTFSFFVGHHLSTIEGGMICTDSEELRDMLVMVRAHGWDRNLSPSAQEYLRRQFAIDNFYAKYTFYDLGYNVRPTEINGFLGNEQIQYWDTIVNKRVDNFEKFQAAAVSNPDFAPLKVNHMTIISNFAMPIICRDENTLRKYKNTFEKNGVDIRPVIAGDITLQPFYKKYASSSPACPQARFVHKNGFYFGNNPEMTSEEVVFLCDLLRPSIVKA